MILNLGSGRYPLIGAVNLDLENGWDARTGLPFFAATVEAITVSHMLMYLTEEEQIDLMTEASRVMRRGGIIRITEDDTTDPANLWRDAITLTSPERARQILDEAGRFDAIMEMTKKETMWKDSTLIQSWHGDPPRVFHVEARRRLCD